MHWRYLCEDRVSDSYGLAADEAMALRVGENLSPPVLRLIPIVPAVHLLDVFSE